MMFAGRKIGSLINLVLRRNCISPVSWHPHTSRGKERKLEKYGGKYNVALVLGIGKSREQMRALEDLFRCCGVPLAWEILPESMKHDQEFNDIILAVKRNGLAIKGNLDPEAVVAEKLRPKMSKNMAFRRNLDLHASITECKSFRGLNTKIHKNFDVVIVRQNTEGDNMMLEHSPSDEIVEHLRVITLNNSERVAEAAFHYAKKKKRKKVQCLHRRHILPLSEEVFINGFLLAASRYPDITYEIEEIGRAFNAFLKNPKAMDVVVTNCLDGMMLKSVINGMMGTTSLIAGSNIGDDVIVFEPATKLRDIQFQNPTAYFLSGALLLEYLELDHHANAIRESLEEVFLDKIFPADLGGKASLFTFTKAVIDRVQKKIPFIICSYTKSPKVPCKHKPIPPYKPAII